MVKKIHNQTSENINKNEINILQGKMNKVIDINKSLYIEIDNITNDPTAHVKDKDSIQFYNKKLDEVHNKINNVGSLLNIYSQRNNSDKFVSKSNSLENGIKQFNLDPLMSTSINVSGSINKEYNGRYVKQNTLKNNYVFYMKGYRTKTRRYIYSIKSSSHNNTRIWVFTKNLKLNDYDGYFIAGDGNTPVESFKLLSDIFFKKHKKDDFRKSPNCLVEHKTLQDDMEKVLRLASINDMESTEIKDTLVKRLNDLSDVSVESNKITFGDTNTISILPSKNNKVDLGSSSYQFKNLYIDGTAYLDAIGFGTTAMTLPTTAGTANYVLQTDGSGGLSWAEPHDVTAASNFGTDNRIIKSDGTVKGLQSTGITIDDSNNVTGMSTLSCDAITSTGNVGIGTESPSSKLHVVGTGNITQTLSVEGETTITGKLNANGGAYINGAVSHSPATTGIHLGVVSGQSHRLLAEFCGTTASDSDVMIDFTEPNNDSHGRIYYHLGSNYMTFSTDNSERIRINNSGNVGIGTNSPTQNLDIRGNVRIGDGTTEEQDINFVSANGNWEVGSNNSGNGTDSNQFYIYDGSYRLTVQKGNGNVGIGTSSPTEKLEVAGSLKLTNGSGSTVFSSASSGNVSYTLPSNDGDSDQYLKTDGSGTLSWGAGGSSSVWSISSSNTYYNSGNVGIGTSSPTEKLDIRGNVTSTGDFTLSDGSVLITDADNASSFSVTNNTCSTSGPVASITANGLTTASGLLVTSSGTITSSSEGLVNIVGTGITTGDALKIDLTQGTLNGGNYINCYDDTDSISVFTVGEDGAITSSGTFNNLSIAVQNTGNNTSLYIGNTPSLTDSNATRNIGIGTGVLNSLTSGESNLAIGFFSGQHITAGGHNTGVGFQSCGGGGNGTALTETFGYNTAVGYSCLNAIQGTASYNTAIGRNCGTTVLTTGSFNTLLGADATPSVSSASNQIVIGKGAIGQGNNYAVIGNADVTRLYAAQDGAGVLYANGTIQSSDRRLKENIQTTTLGLSFINELKPVSYKWIKDKQSGHKTHYGLIAQDVEKIMNNKGMSRDKYAIVHYDYEQDKYRMNYNELIAPLIKSIQELTTENIILKKKFNNILSENSELKDKVYKLENQMFLILERLSILEKN